MLSNIKKFSSRYISSNPSIRETVEMLGLKYEGHIPEFELQDLRLNPQNVQVMFNGRYKVVAS